jgi:GxxExxY protein
MLHENITSKIIGVFFKVYNKLGYGLLEKVYENGIKTPVTEKNFSIL